MNHALVVGSTGMLRAVSLYLAQRYETVSVITRTKARLDQLAADARRLTHEEITNGVIAAIETDAAIHYIGTVG